MSLNDSQVADVMTNVTDAVNKTIADLGMEFRDDADAEEIEEVEDGETPYTQGQIMIEDFAGKLSELLRMKR